MRLGLSENKRFWYLLKTLRQRRGTKLREIKENNFTRLQVWKNAEGKRLKLSSVLFGDTLWFECSKRLNKYEEGAFAVHPFITVFNSPAEMDETTQSSLWLWHSDSGRMRQWDPTPHGKRHGGKCISPPSKGFTFQWLPIPKVWNWIYLTVCTNFVDCNVM